MAKENLMAQGSTGFKSLFALAVVAGAAVYVAWNRMVRRLEHEAKTTKTEHARWEDEGGPAPAPKS